MKEFFQIIVNVLACHSAHPNSQFMLQASIFRDHGMLSAQQLGAARWSSVQCPGESGMSVASGTDKLLLGAEWQGTALVDELKPLDRALLRRRDSATRRWWPSRPAATRRWLPWKPKTRDVAIPYKIHNEFFVLSMSGPQLIDFLPQQFVCPTGWTFLGAGYSCDGSYLSSLWSSWPQPGLQLGS